MVYKVDTKQFEYAGHPVEIVVQYWENMPGLGEAYRINVRVGERASVNETRDVPAHRREREGLFSTKKVETDLDKEIQIVWEKVKQRLDKIGRRTDKTVSINVSSESRHE